MAVAASGSVGETIAPSTNALDQGRPSTSSCATTATPTLVAATSPIASNEIERVLARRSRSEVKNAAPYRSGGSTPKKTSSGSSSISGIPGMREIPNPPRTRRMGYGIRSLGAIASKVAAATRSPNAKSPSWASRCTRSSCRTARRVIATAGFALDAWPPQPLHEHVGPPGATPPVVRGRHCSAKGEGDLLQKVVRVLHPGLHARVDDRVADLLARGVHEDREGRAPVRLGERDGVQRSPFVPSGRALVDLGRDDPLVRDDLAVLAVEPDLGPVLRHHHVAPRAADPQVDLGARHLAALRVPPALDEVGRGQRLVHEVLGRVELPRDEDLLVRGERHRRRSTTHR